MGVILTKNVGSGSSSGSTGAYSQLDKLALEMEMEFKTANTSYFKDLDYTDGLLTNINIWTDSGMTLRLFSKLFQYDVDENLTKILLTRDTDSAQLLKILEYDGSGNLDTITVSASA